MAEVDLSLRTCRLMIVALDLDNLFHYVHHYEEVHQNLEKSCDVIEHAPDVKYAFANAYYLATNNPDQYFWYTSWEIILIESEAIIGGLCFKGPPDDTGAVEIGYSIYDNYEGHGYATEAITALITWAFKTHGISKFTATVAHNNIKSKRVLVKLGFKIDSYDDSFEWWLKEI